MKTGIVLVGVAVMIVGYGLVYGGVDHFVTYPSSAFPWGPISVLQALIPGALPKQAPSEAAVISAQAGGLSGMFSSRYLHAAGASGASGAHGRKPGGGPH